MDVCEATRIEDLEIIKTLDGVKNILGSSFLAEMGELFNFKSYKSLIATWGSIHQLISRESMWGQAKYQNGGIVI